MERLQRAFFSLIFRTNLMQNSHQNGHESVRDQKQSRMVSKKSTECVSLTRRCCRGSRAGRKRGGVPGEVEPGGEAGGGGGREGREELEEEEVGAGGEGGGDMERP
eukprot:549106-Hanusia_phi.AAC.1